MKTLARSLLLIRQNDVSPLKKERGLLLIVIYSSAVAESGEVHLSLAFRQGGMVIWATAVPGDWDEDRRSFVDLDDPDIFFFRARIPRHGIPRTNEGNFYGGEL